MVKVFKQAPSAAKRTVPSVNRKYVSVPKSVSLLGGIPLLPWAYPEFKSLNNREPSDFSQNNNVLETFANVSQFRFCFEGNRVG